MSKDFKEKKGNDKNRADDLAMVTGLMGFDKPQPHNTDVEKAILSDEILARKDDIIKD